MSPSPSATLVSVETPDQVRAETWSEHANTVSAVFKICIFTLNCVWAPNLFRAETWSQYAQIISTDSNMLRIFIDLSLSLLPFWSANTMLTVLNMSRVLIRV
jgi:hypothetical protein